MNQHCHPVVINDSTGEVLPNFQPTPAYRHPKIPAAYNRGKQGQQLFTLLDLFYNPWKYNTDLYLGENKFGTQYCYIYSRFLFIDSPEFRDQITHMAIQYFNFLELSNTAVNHLIQVLRTDDFIWNKDHQNINTPSIRILNEVYPNIFYTHSKGNYIALVNTNYHQPTRNQEVFIPKQAEWPDTNYRWDMFSPATLNQMANSPENFISNLDALLDQLQLPKVMELLFLSALIHSFVADEHLLLEIIADDDAQGEIIFNIFKALIDPVSDYAKPLPKKAEEIKRYALNEYLMSFDIPSNKKLSSEQQETLLGILKGTATIDALPKSKYPSKCQVKRPILLKATDTVIDLPKLRERTVTLHIPKIHDFNQPTIERWSIDNSRLELIRLCQLCSYVNYPQFHTRQMPFSVELTEFQPLKGLISIGCELSRVFHGSTDRFVNKFKEWAIQDLFMQLDHNDSAYLVYVWAKEHTSSKAEQSLKDWLNELEYYANKEGIDLTKISPRKFGADLKQAKALLEKLGIHCVSNGNSKRLSSWKISVGNEVGINDSIIVKPM